MLKLNLGEALREEFKAWLKSNPVPSIKKDSSLDTFIETGRKWQKSLAAAKFLGVHWPKEYGGRGLSLVDEAVIQEELVRVNSPQILGLFGLTMVGPVLIKHGTDEQKKRFLQKILLGDEIWCQGFSEPNAGSDLSNIKTKAEKTDGGFLITGQKVWTSFAQIADLCFALCRTSETGKKHEGLTYILIDMKAKGITVRPLKQISGEDEFNEVFFDKVFVPDENIVGAVGDGWKIAISTLMYERVVLTFARQLQSEVALNQLIKTHGKSPSEIVKRDIAKCVVDACAVRALSYSHIKEYTEGKMPGPEGSLDKLFWSESFQELSKLILKLDGINGVSSEESNPNILRYLYSRGRTIAAGTSEIQRSIIAERILGMPKGR